MRADSALRILFIVTPLLMALDVLGNVVTSIKDTFFSFRDLASYVHEDLSKYVAILLGTAIAVLSGVDFTVAVDAEKTVIVFFLMTLVTSVALHLQDLTGIKVAFWENYFSNMMETFLHETIDFTDNPSNPVTITPSTTAVPIVVLPPPAEKV